MTILSRLMMMMMSVDGRYSSEAKRILLWSCNELEAKNLSVFWMYKQE